MADVAGTTPCGACGTQVDELTLVCPGCGGNPRAARGRGRGERPDSERGGDATAPEPGDAQVRSHSQAIVVACEVEMPNFERIPIPADGKLELGRESGTPQIDAALARYVDVSRRHAVIEHVAGRLTITELQADGFGTEINGTRLVPFKATPVSPGDIVRLGTYCYMRLEVPRGRS